MFLVTSGSFLGIDCGRRHDEVENGLGSDFGAVMSLWIESQEKSTSFEISKGKVVVDPWYIGQKKKKEILHM